MVISIKGEQFIHRCHVPSEGGTSTNQANPPPLDMRCPQLLQGSATHTVSSTKRWVTCSGKALSTYKMNTYKMNPWYFIVQDTAYWCYCTCMFLEFDCELCISMVCFVVLCVLSVQSNALTV
jgi:hypothetical protein